MDIPRYLRDVYRFPGLVPSASVRGYPGDADAIILSLRRRRKKTICEQCGHVHRSFYDQRPRLIRDLSCGDKRVYLSVNVRRVDCWRCGAVKTEVWSGCLSCSTRTTPVLLRWADHASQPSKALHSRIGLLDCRDSGPRVIQAP